MYARCIKITVERFSVTSDLVLLITSLCIFLIFLDDAEEEIYQTAGK